MHRSNPEEVIENIEKLTSMRVVCVERILLVYGKGSGKRESELLQYRNNRQGLAATDYTLGSTRTKMCRK